MGLPDNNRAQGQTNAQEHLHWDMTDSTGHYAASLCDMATGPIHTFFMVGEVETRQLISALWIVGLLTWF